MPPKTRSQTKDSYFGQQAPENAGLVRNTWHVLVERDCLLDAGQLKRLSEHKYSATSTSYLDELCMQRFWNWLVQYYPKWLAPNLITTIGLIVNLSSVLVLSYYNPTGREFAPRWTYVMCGLGMFLYQTLDATDGKQARRTNTASPVGELFDHGCDSVTQVFVCLIVCLSLNLGRYDGVIVLTCAIAVSLFYFAHWSTYCTGTLKFEKFDVTEAQWCIIATCLATAIFGPQFWFFEIPTLQVPLNLALVGLVFVGVILQSAAYLKIILGGGCGKNGSTVAGTSVLFPALPLLIYTSMFLMMYFKSDSGVFADNIVLFCINFGMVASKICNRIIIAYMSKSELDWWDSVYISPILMILNQYFNNIVPELPMLYICLVFAFVNLMLHAIYVIRQLDDYLNISCFTIPIDKQQ